MTHPYENLESRAFWRSAAAEPDPLAIRGVWKPKFAIQPDDPVSTAGSCFAQHIGRALSERGFEWCDAEPAPSCLTPEDRQRFNYGIFSFRTANIYTTAMLRQWMEWGLGETAPPDEVWKENGRFFDPFRPAIEPGGFESAEELLLSRMATARAVRRAVKRSAVFTFTLGLTEGWINREHGYVYAACPGTLQGRFDAKLHAFRNFTQSQVLADLTAAFDMAREINPDIRFLLTVSPVPLIATASGEHALVATTYSKSVLRAAAGEYVQTRDYADYFPSYELITGAPFRARFYEDNLRSVTPQGVAFVMDAFFRCLRETHDLREPVKREKKPAEKTQDDIVCEEDVLAQFDDG